MEHLISIFACSLILYVCVNRCEELLNEDEILCVQGVSICLCYTLKEITDF